MLVPDQRPPSYFFTSGLIFAILLSLTTISVHIGKHKGRAVQMSEVSGTQHSDGQSLLSLTCEISCSKQKFKQ